VRICLRHGCARASFAILIGCGDAGPPEDDAATSGGSSIPTTSSTGLGGSAQTSGATTEGSNTTGVDTSAGSETTGAALQPCGIDDLAPGAANPIVASDRIAMQLPTEIGDILARSCGCHFADDLIVPGDYPQAGTLDLTTWSAWHSDFGEVPTYEAARLRVEAVIPVLLMPPPMCDVGDGETMLPADRARLLEWIAALAPDGPTWAGM